MRGKVLRTVNISAEVSTVSSVVVGCGLFGKMIGAISMIVFIY